MLTWCSCLLSTAVDLLVLCATHTCGLILLQSPLGDSGGCVRLGLLHGEQPHLSAIRVCKVMIAVTDAFRWRHVLCS